MRQDICSKMDIYGLPEFTREDLKMAYGFYGIPVAYMRGKLTKKFIAHAVIAPMTIMKEKVKVYKQMSCM